MGQGGHCQKRGQTCLSVTYASLTLTPLRYFRDDKHHTNNLVPIICCFSPYIVTGCFQQRIPSKATTAIEHTPVAVISWPASMSGGIWTCSTRRQHVYARVHGAGGAPRQAQVLFARPHKRTPMRMRIFSDTRNKTTWMTC